MILNILDKINSPEDLNLLTERERGELCRDVRDFLLQRVSETGGHLASNLGIVELTVALHLTFELASDRLVFDVGHQCYVHKILTGRREGFHTLRKLGGMSGFPKPDESVYDAFIAGHASNSISVALGLARARSLAGQEHSVVALIGDGALTGGMAYEALCDAGDAGEPLIVVLNDNGMSITENVGGMARYLARQRIKPSYLRFKKRYHRLMEIIPGGQAIRKLAHNIKSVLKRALLHCSMFEEMGFQYLGPVDGHDINAVCRALELAREHNAPVIVHVVTQKGRGYAPSERTPELYHGVSDFDPDDGVVLTERDTFSSVFGRTLTKLAAEDERIVAVTAAMISGTGLEGFGKRFPRRLFDVGIAEGHAAAMTAGLSVGGLLPVFAVYSTFLQRSYDMLLHDVALSGARAIFAIDRAGIVPGDGETHQGVYDVAFLATVPNMKIYAPSNFAELQDMMTAALTEDTGSVAIRYPKGGEGTYRDGGAEAAKRICEGSTVTVVTYGAMVDVAIEASEMLADKGISVELIKLGVLAPIDMDAIAKSVGKTGAIITIEDSARAGSVGERIMAKLTEMSIVPRSAEILSTGARMLPGASVDELRKMCGLDAESVCKSIMRVCNASVDDHAVYGGVCDAS